jgi:putative redox protein
VVVSEAAPPGYAQTVTDGVHSWVIDEPLAVGGTDTGPNPYVVLLSALGACTAITMRMYAGRKGWDLGATSVSLRHSRIHAEDCVDCESAVGMVDHVERRISLDPALTPAQRAALLAIADKCPVHRTLTGSVHVPHPHARPHRGGNARR